MQTEQMTIEQQQLASSANKYLNDSTHKKISMRMLKILKEYNVNLTPTQTQWLLEWCTKRYLIAQSSLEPRKDTLPRSRSRIRSSEELSFIGIAKDIETLAKIIAQLPNGLNSAQGEGHKDMILRTAVRTAISSNSQRPSSRIQLEGRGNQPNWGYLGNRISEFCERHQLPNSAKEELRALVQKVVSPGELTDRVDEVVREQQHSEKQSRLFKRMKIGVVDPESGLRLPFPYEISNRWSTRDKSENITPAEFLQKHYCAYLNANLLYQDVLKVLDRSLYVSLKAWCFRRGKTLSEFVPTKSQRIDLEIKKIQSARYDELSHLDYARIQWISNWRKNKASQDKSAQRDEEPKETLIYSGPLGGMSR